MFGHGKEKKDIALPEQKQEPKEQPDLLSKAFDDYVRTYFPELPFPEYFVPKDLYQKLLTECSAKNMPSLALLQEIIIGMEKHIGLENSHCVVKVEKTRPNDAGYIERNSTNYNLIVVRFDEDYLPNNYLAIIAHEMSHAYQFEHGRPTFIDRTYAEEFTDALTAYLGFGEYTIAGKNAFQSDKFGMTRKTIGYASRELFYHVMQNATLLHLEKLAKEEAAEKRNQAIMNVKANYAMSLQYIASLRKILARLENVMTIGKFDILALQEITARYPYDFEDRLQFLDKEIETKGDAEVLAADKTLQEIVDKLLHDFQIASRIERKQKKNN